VTLSLLNTSYITAAEGQALSHGFRYSSWLGRAVGIATAYLIAVQLVLAAVVGAQMAVPTTDGATLLCFGGRAAPSDETGQRKSPVVHHAFCAVCAFASHASPLPEPSFLRNERSEAAAAFRSDPVKVAASIRQHDPRSSQGPPLNA
jgi:hypothetical protein